MFKLTRLLIFGMQEDDLKKLWMHAQMRVGGWGGVGREGTNFSGELIMYYKPSNNRAFDRPELKS